MKRYSVITEKNPREILLLRGSGCKWRKCTFCDYHLDFSKDADANFRLNKEVLQQVTGEWGVLETINSGSFSDLDDRTVEEIRQVCIKKEIHRLHIEVHWRDRSGIPDIRRRFESAGVTVCVKMGVETFDPVFRDDILKKGMEYANPQDIALWADEVCLLFGITGQTAESMKRDLETGLSLFQRVCVNIMTENSTAVHPDAYVIREFFQDVYPLCKDNQRVDVLLENTDFGVGGTEDAQ